MCNTFCPTRRRYVSRDIVVDDVVLKMPGPPGLKRVVRHANQVMKEYGVKSLHNGTSIEASLLWEKTDKKALYQDNYGRYWIQIFFDACTSYKRGKGSIVNGGLRFASTVKHWNQFSSVENL